MFGILKQELAWPVTARAEERKILRHFTELRTMGVLSWRLALPRTNTRLFTRIAAEGRARQPRPGASSKLAAQSSLDASQ